MIAELPILIMAAPIYFNKGSAVSPVMLNLKSQASRKSIKLALYAFGLSSFILGAAALTGFGYTVVMAKRVAGSIIESDAYISAKEAVAEEESLERKYRLEPSKAVLAKYEAASSKLQLSLFEIANLGESSDKKLCDEVMRNHTKYLHATSRLFAAVDTANWKMVQEIDTNEVDPIFDKIETQIDSAADAHRHFALDGVNKYLRMQSLVFLGLVAIIVIVVLLLFGFVWMYVREQRFVQAVTEHEHLSQHDPLTGLPNRLLFTTHAETVLEECANTRQVAVMLLDLDRFKEINDTYGHHIGDELLQQVATRLSSTIKSSQMVARLSGDEFAAILPDIKDHAEAVQVATNMVSIIKDEFNLSGITVSIGVSVGISYAPEHGTTITELLKAADAAMYTAKRERAGYAVYVAKKEEI